ncbi:MAG: PAS domain-containing sensor histidine kinase [Candidatus Thorarchaeota archaeon]|nr:PAS domain-containing sensor histidine kinase [Candidatus Thorarchaeota archaeon]
MASINPMNPEFPEGREALDKILEYSLEGIAVFRDDKIVEYVNERLCDILGRERHEILGQPFDNFVHHESPELIMEQYSSRLDGEALPWTCEAKLLHRNGQAREVRIHNSFLTSGKNRIRVLTQIIDITEEKRYQQALSRHEVLYHTLVNTMNEGLGVIDDNGILVQANPALCKMIDYTEEDLIGKPIFDVMAGLTRDEVFCKIKERMVGKSDRYETHIIHSSGRLIPVTVSASPIFEDASKYIGSCVVITDITRRKAIERHLQVARSRAKMYLDFMRHDIRNHLQEVQVAAELLLLNDLGSSVSDLVENILHAVSKSITTISNSGVMEVLTNLPLKERILDDVLCESMKDASILLDDVVISLSLHVTDARVQADDYLELLVSELLVNSYENNPSDEKRIWIELECDDSQYVLSVSDNGPGLSEITKRRLFDPGSRIEGIGFHLAHDIVEKYGGTIEVFDRVKGDLSQGKTIRVTFPKIDL